MKHVKKIVSGSVLIALITLIVMYFAGGWSPTNLVMGPSDFDRGVEAYQRSDYDKKLSDDFDSVFRAYGRGDYVTALDEWLPLAEQGDADAQNNLGNMYATGQGVPEDDVEAVAWYRQAAEQGHAAAQYSLGFMYFHGRGVPKDPREAVTWYRRAAEQGVAAAQTMLGTMYAYGIGVPEDDHEAVNWYREAAEQGYAAAQSALGFMYDNGQGVPEDDHEAVIWYRKAAEQGLAGAQYNLGRMYANGEGVSKDDREAATWYRKAAEQGNALAQTMLGRMYDNGQGVPEDDREAVIWYRKAADQGDAGAQYNLGNMYHIGSGVEKDDREAVTWYRRAAEQGLAEAQYNLGVKYANGEGVPENAVQAYAWLNLAAAQDNTRAVESKELITTRMTPAQIAEAQTLSHTLDRRISGGNTVAEGDQSIPSTGASMRSSGSGFFVSTDGHLVTNRHVIDGCSRVTVTASGVQFDANVLLVDEPNDLALLKVGGGQREPAVLRSSHRAVLGEQVTVAGFPLSGLLADDLNVTSGAISALAGLGNNPRVLQITAPVQSGNSGGPLLDKGGQVIGVVVSKLNAPEIYRATGELPQNINFAVKGTLLRGFLDIHGVNYRTGDTQVALSGENVAAKARRFVVLVGCW